MTDVKGIFNNTYKLYNVFKDEALFHAIISNLSEEDPKSVTNILTDTYNFYIKYQNCWKDDDWSSLVKESRVIDSKYNSKLCRAILLAILDILEEQYKNKGNVYGKSK